MRIATPLTILLLAITSLIHSAQIKELRREIADMTPINKTQSGPVESPEK